jgi:hypothetical protein
MTFQPLAFAADSVAFSRVPKKGLLRFSSTIPIVTAPPDPAEALALFELHPATARAQVPAKATIPSCVGLWAHLVIFMKFLLRAGRQLGRVV